MGWVLQGCGSGRICSCNVVEILAGERAGCVCQEGYVTHCFALAGHPREVPGAVEAVSDARCAARTRDVRLATHIQATASASFCYLLSMHSGEANSSMSEAEDKDATHAPALASRCQYCV